MFSFYFVIVIQFFQMVIQPACQFCLVGFIIAGNIPFMSKKTAMRYAGYGKFRYAEIHVCTGHFNGLGHIIYT